MTIQFYPIQLFPNWFVEPIASFPRSAKIAMTRGPEIEQDAFEAIQGGEFIHKSHGCTVFHIVTTTKTMHCVGFRLSFIAIKWCFLFRHSFHGLHQWWKLGDQQPQHGPLPGLWRSSKGECAIFTDQRTNRLTYEERLGELFESGDTIAC